MSRHPVHDDLQQVPHAKLTWIGDREHLRAARQDRVLLHASTGDGDVAGDDRHARGGDLRWAVRLCPPTSTHTAR